MATRKQASERVIDLILDLVIENEGLDTRPISKRIIDHLHEGKLILYKTST